MLSQQPLMQKTRSMSNEASDRLKQNAEKIMRMWEKRARDQVGASTHQNSLVLQDSLPLYLNQLVDELSNRIDRTPARITADEVESTRIGKLQAMNGRGMLTTL